MIYKGGWLAYDGVVDSTSGLTQEPEAHSLVRFVAGGNTVGMREGTTSEMMAVARGDGWVHTAGDLTAAFGSTDEVSRWQRELVFIEPDCVVIYDRADSAAGVQQIWQMVSPVQATITGAQASLTASGHRLTVQRVLPASATATTLALSGDFSGGFRYEEATGGGSTRHLHVLWLDGAVGSATSSPDGGRDGVAITFADGRTATVRFDPAQLGGTLSIRGGGGDVDATLGRGIATLPELE
jgi:hypothetical protein